MVKKEPKTQPMVNDTPIKSSFEWQGRMWKSYTNGKRYGDTRYITCTSDNTKSQVKITYSLSRGISVGGARSLDFARVALRSLGFDE